MASEIRVELVGDARSLERAFAKSSKSAQKFQGSMDKTAGRSRRSFGLLSKATGALGVSLGGAAIVGGLKATINASKDLGESVNAVEVVFGKASKTITRFSEKAITEAGLSMREFNELATPLGAMLRNTGDSAEEAATKTVTLAKRAADMASVFNTDVPTALEAVQSALRGEADPIEKFGVKLNEAAVKAEAMRLGLTDGKGAIDENAKAAARYSLILQQTNRYQGDFKNTSGGLANQQRILSAALENLSAKLGTALLPIVTKVTTALADWLSKSKNQKTVMDTLNAIVKTVATSLNVLKTVFETLSAVVGGHANAIKLLVAVYATFKVASIAASVKGLAGSFGLLATKQKTAATSAAGMRGSLLGKAGLVGAVGLLSFELTTAILKMTGLDKKLHSLGGSVADLLGKGGEPEAIPGGTSKSFRFLRNRARQLRERGFSTAQTAAQLAKTHPGVSEHDIRVASSGIVINGGLHLHGIQNVKQLEDALHKRSKQRPQPRRSGR